MRHPAWFVRLVWCVIVVASAEQGWGAEQAGAGQEQPSNAESLNFDVPYRPLLQEEIDAAREELLTAVRELERLFEREDEADVETWKRELRWDDLTAELAKGDKFDGKTLNEIRNTYRNGLLKGLERESFRKVRSALEQYLNLGIYFVDQQRTEEFYRKAIGDLKTGIDAFRATPSVASAQLLGPILARLRRTRQAPELIGAVDAEFVRPNFYAEVSQSLIAAAFDEPVEERTSIRDTILGTALSGTATLVGDVTGRATESDSAATIAIRLTGTARSRNVGYNGPVTIHSHGNTAIRATTKVLIDEAGVRYAKPLVSASTNTVIDSICASCKLVRKVAWKRASGSKSEAESIASSKARQRVYSRVNSQAGDLVADADANYQKRFRTPLLRWDAFPAKLLFTSAESGVRVEATQVADNQTAAYDQPPAATSSHDMVMQVHESAVANAAERIIGGYQLTDVRIAELYKEADRPVPAGLLAEDEEPWGLLFSSDKPFQTHFENGRVRFEIWLAGVLRGENYTPASLSGGNEVHIVADYELQLTEQGIQLVRDQALEILICKNREPVPLGLGASVQGFLRGKFGPILTEKIPINGPTGFKLPGRFERAGNLVGREAKSEGGWLVVGFDREATPATDAIAPQNNQTASTGP